MRQEGVVVKFGSGYGFVKPKNGGPHVFCHYSDIELTGYKELYPNERVEYDAEQTPRGLRARHIKILAPEAAA